MIKFKDQGQYEIVIVVLSSILFIFLCLYFIFHRILWWDEFMTIITVRRPFLDGLLQLEDYSAPLYQLLLRLLVSSDNPPGWLIRIPAVIFGTLGLLASWRFTRILFGRKVAILTLILISINPVFIYYATEARPYSLFILLTVLSMWSFYNLLKIHNRKNILLYIMFTSLLLYAHYFGLFTLIGQITFTISVFLLQKNKIRDLDWLFYAFGFVLLISSPSLFLMCRYIFLGVPGIVGLIYKPSPIALINPSDLFGLTRIISVFFITSLIIEIWGRPFIFDGESFWFEKPQQDIGISDWFDRRYNALFCLNWIIFNYFIMIIISMTIRPIYVIRYYVPAIVPISIIIILTINRIKSQKILAAGMLILVLAMAANIQKVQNTTTKCHEITKYPELVKFLKQNNNAQTRIFIADNPYCDKFINPDWYALRYYGLNKDNISLLRLKGLRKMSFAQPEQLLADKRLYIVSGWVNQTDFADILKNQPRPFRKIDFGQTSLFELEKQSHTADWSTSKELP